MGRFVGDCEAFSLNIKEQKTWFNAPIDGHQYAPGWYYRWWEQVRKLRHFLRGFIMSNNFCFEKKVSPESGKQLPPLFNSLPEHRAFNTLHCAQKATSTRVAWQILFFTAAKLGQWTCCKNEVFICNISVVSAPTREGARWKTRSYCSALAVASCIDIGRIVPGRATVEFSKGTQACFQRGKNDEILI